MRVMESGTSLEAGRVAELRQILPDAQQRLLRRILGEVDVAQDPARHGQEPVREPEGKVGVGLPVSSLGSDHEIGIHRPLPLGRTGSDRCVHTVWAIRKASAFNLRARNTRWPRRLGSATLTKYD